MFFKGLVKYLLVALMVFAAYNEFFTMYLNSKFNDVTVHEDKGYVIAAIGQPKYIYMCNSGAAPGSFTYIDSFCEEGVQEVDAFALCSIPPRCPGWNYVSFNANNKAVTTYHYVPQ